MRIIIAGAGEVGTHLAKMLSNENHEIIIIEPDDDRLKPIESSMDVLTFLPYTSYHTAHKAKLDLEPQS